MSYKILVVDDEQDVRDVLQRKLQREGYAVVCAKDGEEAIVMLASEDPDIILLDLVLPGCNGFDVLKQVREKFNDRWRPVIIVSAQQDLETTKKCYHLEADHYLPKPCGIDHVLAGVQTMVSLMPYRQKE
jgi:DNA-binding response OmpR family regulator